MERKKLLDERWLVLSMAGSIILAIAADLLLTKEGPPLTVVTCFLWMIFAFAYRIYESDVKRHNIKIDFPVNFKFEVHTVFYNDIETNISGVFVSHDPKTVVEFLTTHPNFKGKVYVEKMDKMCSLDLNNTIDKPLWWDVENNS